MGVTSSQGLAAVPSSGVGSNWEGKSLGKGCEGSLESWVGCSSTGRRVTHLFWLVWSAVMCIFKQPVIPAILEVELGRTKLEARLERVS